MTTISAPSTTASGRKIRVIGVPLDLGQSRRGVDMGPSAVRVAGLEARLEALGHEVEDGGNVAVAIPEQKKAGRRQREVPERNHRYLHQARGVGGQNAGSGAGPTVPGRRSLHGRRHGLWGRRILSPSESAHRTHLDRRPHRHQYSRLLSQRQRSRHAAALRSWDCGTQSWPTSSTSLPRSGRKTACW